MRRLVVGSLIFGVGLLVVSCLVIAVWIWNSSDLTLDQRLVAVGDTLAAGGLCLAILASVVAVLAYRVSVRRPTLVATIKLPPRLGRDESLFEVGLGGPDQAGERHIEPPPNSGPSSATIPLVLRIQNVSDWSARNVAVRVDFKGMRGGVVPIDWSRAAFDAATGQVNAIQWEGGADQAIHGNWTRELPPIQLAGLLVDPPLDKCELSVEVVAEGFRKSWTFAVTCITQGGVFDRETGSLEGWAGYPSSSVPSLRVYAIPLRQGLAPQRMTIPDGPAGKLRWFRFAKLEPGEYHVVAYPHGFPGPSGAYTVASTTNDFTAAANHALVAVHVKAGSYTEDVRITDWYSRNFPPEPRTTRQRVLGLND